MRTARWLDQTNWRLWLPVAALLIALSGCQPDTTPELDEPANPWLGSVPTTSAFLLANQKPLEDAEFDRLIQTLGPVLRLLSDELQTSRGALLSSMVWSFDGAQDWRQAGLDPNGFWAIYSHDRQMVARIPLSDEAAFWSSWARANGPTPTQGEQQSALPGHQDMDGIYRRVAIPMGPLEQPWPALLGLSHSGRLIVETQGQWLNVSWQDTQDNQMEIEIETESEIGANPVRVQKPTTEYWSGTTWAAFNQANGLDGKVGGYINVPALMSQQAPVSPTCDFDFDSNSNFNSDSHFDCGCDRAWAQLGAQMPQLIMGSQALTRQEMTLLTRVLLPKTDATISKTPLSPPSIDVSQARLAKVAGLGLAIDVAESRQTLIDQLQLSQEISKDCPGFEPIKQSRRWAQGLANRPVPPIITSIQGLMTRFDGFETDVKTTPTDQHQPPSAQFFTEVHLQNPQFLIGLAGLFSPDLASLDLRANQPLQPLPSTLVDAFGGVPVYLSTTDSSIRASSANPMDAPPETHADDPQTLPWVSGTLNFGRLNELSDVVSRWPMSKQNQAVLAEMMRWGALGDIQQLQWLIQPSQDGIDVVISTQHSLESLPAVLE